MRENAFAATAVLRQHRPNVLRLEGDIDLHVSPGVTESLNAMIKKKPQWIVIDLSRATYIDSAGVAALILAMQEVEAYGGKFLLSGLQETLRSIFETSRLDRIFRIFPDVDAALAASGSVG
jgi:anti-sigma B factor antagonist